jgi:ABC-2 type transport system permease protein
VTPPTTLPPPPAVARQWRAWCYLVWLSLRGQSRSSVMMWVAVGLLALAVLAVSALTASGRWAWRRTLPFPPSHQSMQSESDRLKQLSMPLFPSDALRAIRLDFIRLMACPQPSHAHALAFATLGSVEAIREPVLPIHWDYIGSTHFKPAPVLSQTEFLDRAHATVAACPLPAGSRSVGLAILGTSSALLSPHTRTDDGARLAWPEFQSFSQVVVFTLFLSFLLPICSMAFATEALGGERESGTLVWLLSRPLSRPAIYLAKFVAVLPWSVGFNLVGFALLCLAGGLPGWRALQLFWPPVAVASVTFSALFFLLGATVRWPAVLGMVYSFCLEVVLARMPGYLKRVSINYYTRCILYDSVNQWGFQPEDARVFLPVEAWTAWSVLVGTTVVLLVLGMVIFSQMQFREQV